MPEELLPKPQTDLPLPEKELPTQVESGRKLPIPKIVFLGIIFVILLGILGGAYSLGRNSALKELNPSNPAIPPKSPVIYQGTPTPDPTADWKTLQGENYSLEYPSNWNLIDKNIIAEKSFIPGEQDPNQTYNIIEIQKYNNQIYAGYTNKQWYEKLKSLKFGKTFTDQRNIYKRIDTFPNYVSVFISPSSTAITTPTYQIKTYILKDQTIYIVTLDLYNMNGSETLRNILSTFKFTK